MDGSGFFLLLGRVYYFLVQVSRGGTMRTIWESEWKMMTRQRSSFAFVGLWVIVFSLIFILENNNQDISGFTNTAGTIVNILLYLLPLFMMLIGSFSIANEMESGQWQLLNTYPLNLAAYFTGKFLGLFTSQWILFTFSFGVSMLIGQFAGSGISISWLFNIYLFSLFLMFFFLIIGLLLGTFVNTRWKALLLTVISWFFTILIWPTALISLLSLLPYPMIRLFMKLAMVANPAEFLRVFFISHWDGGAIFGQPYDSIVQLFHSQAGWLILAGYLFAAFFVFTAFSLWNLKRRQGR